MLFAARYERSRTTFGTTRQTWFGERDLLRVQAEPVQDRLDGGVDQRRTGSGAGGREAGAGDDQDDGLATRDLAVPHRLEERADGDASGIVGVDAGDLRQLVTVVRDPFLGNAENCAPAGIVMPTMTPSAEMSVSNDVRLPQLMTAAEHATSRTLGALFMGGSPPGLV